jgi:hypothetical protein
VQGGEARQAVDLGPAGCPLRVVEPDERLPAAGDVEDPVAAGRGEFREDTEYGRRPPLVGGC